jgi:flagellin
MPSILTNAAAEGANANINIHSRNAAASVGKLSSGSRIVRPADDAASLAISNKLKSNIATLTQAKVNAGQTSSLLQIAGGGVTRVSEILTRLKTLSTQAVNGTLSNAERQISQEEFGQLVKQIDNTVNQTQLNGIKLLAGGANASFKAGTNVTAASEMHSTLQTITGTFFDEGSINLTNYTGAVEGTIDDVRVTRNDANTNYIIEMDIKNGAQMETFRGEVKQDATAGSTIQFKSTTNGNNGFTAVTDAALDPATGNEDDMESDLKQILGVGTGASEVVFRAANITESANAFRSDVTVVSSLAGTAEYLNEGQDAGTTLATDTITIAGSKGTVTTTAGDISVTATIGDIRDLINSRSEQTGVAATLKDTDGDNNLNLVLYSLDPAETFTITNAAGSALGSTGVGITTVAVPTPTSTAQTAGGYSNILSASSSTAAGRYTLTSSFDSNADTTTFRIQDQKGQTYDAVVKDVSDIGDNANLTTVSFSNGVELTFTNDQLRRTSSTLAADETFQQVTFGSNNYEFRFDVEKSGKASVTTQVGLDAFNDLLTVELDSISTKELGITNASGANLIAIDTVGNAQTAQGVIDEAIDTLNKNTAKIGALQSRFSQIDTNLTTVIENSNAANGQFVDVDFAAESSNFYKNQALLQAAVGVAAQANQMPQQLLRLVG